MNLPQDIPILMGKIQLFRGFPSDDRSPPMIIWAPLFPSLRNSKKRTCVYIYIYIRTNGVCVYIYIYMFYGWETGTKIVIRFYVYIGSYLLYISLYIIYILYCHIYIYSGSMYYILIYIYIYII